MMQLANRHHNVNNSNAYEVISKTWLVKIVPPSHKIKKKIVPPFKQYKKGSAF